MSTGVKRISIDDLIYGINKQAISGWGNINNGNVTTIGPIPAPRYTNAGLEEELGEVLPDHVYPIGLQRYLNGVYLEKSSNMNGFVTDKNYAGRQVQTAGNYITKNFAVNLAGFAPNEGAGAFAGGLLKKALEAAPAIPPVGKPDGHVPSEPTVYTVMQPNPFPLRTDYVLN
jgi:hypothetical protein